MPEKKKTIKTVNGVRECFVVGVTQTHENFNEYMLEDGSVLKMKTVMSEVLRDEGAFDPDGNPVYYVKSQQVLSVDAPDRLRKKEV